MKKALLIIFFVILLFTLSSCSDQRDTEELARVQENVANLEKEIELKNNEIEILEDENKALNEKIAKLETENNIIHSKVTNTISLENYTLLEKYEIDFDNDNKNETVELYAQVGIYNGEYLWDDGQRWMLLVRDDERSYVLFDDYVQLGSIKVKIYKSFNDSSYHIISILEVGAGYEINDYVYDAENGYFVERLIGEDSNLSWIYLQE